MRKWKSLWRLHQIHFEGSFNAKKPKNFLMCAVNLRLSLGTSEVELGNFEAEPENVRKVPLVLSVWGWAWEGNLRMSMGKLRLSMGVLICIHRTFVDRIWQLRAPPWIFYGCSTNFSHFYSIFLSFIWVAKSLITGVWRSWDSSSCIYCNS